MIRSQPVQEPNTRACKCHHTLTDTKLTPFVPLSHGLLDKYLVFQSKSLANLGNLGNLGKRGVSIKIFQSVKHTHGLAIFGLSLH